MGCDAVDPLFFTVLFALISLLLMYAFLISSPHGKKKWGPGRRFLFPLILLALFIYSLFLLWLFLALLLV